MKKLPIETDKINQCEYKICDAVHSLDSLYSQCAYEEVSDYMKMIYQEILTIREEVNEIRSEFKRTNNKASKISKYKQ